MMTLVAFLIFGWCCFVLGRHYEVRVHLNDLRCLRRRTQQALDEQRDLVSRIPR